MTNFCTSLLNLIVKKLNYFAFWLMGGRGYVGPGNFELTEEQSSVCIAKSLDCKGAKLFTANKVTVASTRCSFVLTEGGKKYVFFEPYPFVPLDAVKNLPYRLKRELVITGTAFFARNVPVKNYYHFMLDTVVPFLWASAFFRDSVLIFNWPLPVEWKELLVNLGIKVVDGTSEKRVEIAVLMPKFEDADYAPLSLLGVRSLRSRLPRCTPLLKRDRLFINRKRINSRYLKTPISDIIERHGFVEIFLEDYPIELQASIVGRASMVLGVHGAGLSNLIFATMPIGVFEIIPEDFKGHQFGFGNGCFRWLTELCGHNYESFIGSKPVQNNEFFELNREEFLTRFELWVETGAELS